jgi:hypothetical protein
VGQQEEEIVACVDALDELIVLADRYWRSAIEADWLLHVHHAFIS